MRDGRVGGQPCIGATQVRRHAVQGLGEALHVNFIEHGIPRRDTRWAVFAPIEARAHHEALGSCAAIVMRVGFCVFIGMSEHVAKLIGCAHYAVGNASCVRIQEQKCGVAAQALRGIVRPMHAKSIELACTQAWDESVPDVIRQHGEGNALRFPSVRGKQADFHTVRDAGVDREIDTMARGCGAEGPVRPRLHAMARGTRTFGRAGCQRGRRRLRAHAALV